MNKMLMVSALLALACAAVAVPVDGPVLSKVTAISVSAIQITTTNGGTLVVTAPYAWRDSAGAIVPGHAGALVLNEPMLSAMLGLNFAASKAAIVQVLTNSANNTVTLQLHGSLISASILVSQARPDGGQLVGTITWPDVAALGFPTAQVIAGIQTAAQAAVSAK